MLFLDYSTNKNTRREKNRFVYMYNLYTKNIILCCITFYLYRIYSCGPLNCLFSRIIFHNLYKKSPSFPCELTSGVSVYVQCRSLCYTLHMYTVVLPLNKSSDELPGLVLLQSSYDRWRSWMASPQCVFSGESWAGTLGQTFSGKHYNWQICVYYEVFCDYSMIFSGQFCRIDRTLQFSL